MEETYGLQDQRSNSPAFIVFGSRRAKSSSGFVSALTYNLRYSPDFPMYCCTIESEVTTASSSEEPLVKIPVTLRESPSDVEVERYNALPCSILKPGTLYPPPGTGLLQPGNEFSALGQGNRMV